jgi:hypothetical protein
MKKTFLAVLYTIVFCSLLAVPLSSQLASSPLSSSTSQGALQSVPENSSQLTQQTVPEATSQNTSTKTELPTLPENMPVTAPNTAQQTNLQPTSPDGSVLNKRALQLAIEGATNYLAQAEDPYTLLQLNFLYRRFGIAEFADSLQRYDQILAANSENASLLRIFRRIADYDNTVEPSDFHAATADVDKITVPALYSDRFALPGDYLSKLKEAANGEGYLLTHALLATIWLQENHGEIPDSFKASLYTANAELIGNDLVMNDLEIEAAAFLYVAGQGSQVDFAFVQRVITAQNQDGGWSYSNETPDVSNWHSSVLGLMLLLHVEFPADSYPPMLAPASVDNGVGLNPTSACSTVLLLFVFVSAQKKIMQFGLRQPYQRRST